MTNIIFKVIKYGGEEHEQALALRKEVLYEPFGISLSDYGEEDSHIQIVGLDRDTIVSSCLLVPEEDDCRMRYVAIKSDVQGGGIGSKMLAFFEEQARSKGFKSIYCHARLTATNFYAKNGYKTEGDIFEQVTIPLIKMRKTLT